MNQNERLDYLAEQFAKDYDETVRRTASPYEKASMQYRKLEIPDDAAGKWRLLRSLMNVRMPAPVSEQYIEIESEYLKEETAAKGVTRLADLKPVEDGIYLWQGDITTLECDAIVHLRNGSYGLIEIKLGGARLVEEGAKTLESLSGKIDSTRMKSPSFRMVVVANGDYAYRRKDDGILVCPISSLRP